MIYSSYVHLGSNLSCISWIVQVQYSVLIKHLLTHNCVVESCVCSLAIPLESYLDTTNYSQLKFHYRRTRIHSDDVGRGGSYGQISLMSPVPDNFLSSPPPKAYWGKVLMSPDEYIFKLKPDSTISRPTKEPQAGIQNNILSVWGLFYWRRPRLWNCHPLHWHNTQLYPLR